MYKNILLVAGAVSAFACAAHAANSVTVVNVSLPGNDTVYIKGLGLNGPYHSSALDLTTSTGETLYAICDDLLHEIKLGGQSTVFDVGPIVTDNSGAVSGTGNPLSLAQIGELSTLAHVAYGLITDHASHLSAQLAGVQDAAWLDEYGSKITLTPEGADATLISQYTSQYLTFAASHPSMEAYQLTAADGKSQGQVPGVPEPTTWSLMLVGFGGLGALLRSSRLRQTRAIAA